MQEPNLEELTQRANQGCACACNQLGYHEAEVSGNREAGIAWFRKALEAHCECAPPNKEATVLLNLGCQLYQTGGDAEPSWQRSSELGNPRASFYLGQLLESRNDIRALPAYRKAAMGGVVAARERLQERLCLNAAELESYLEKMNRPPEREAKVTVKDGMVKFSIN
jgi:hypothetical protein